jgi:hypothetical protein
MEAAGSKGADREALSPAPCALSFPLKPLRAWAVAACFQEEDAKFDHESHERKCAVPFEQRRSINTCTYLKQGVRMWSYLFHDTICARLA